MNFRLPEYLTKVTPLSKILALATFILFPIVGFYLGYQYALKSVIPPVPLVLYIQITPTPVISLISGKDNSPQIVKNGSKLWIKLLQKNTVGTQTSFVVDYIEENPCWTPGGVPTPDCPNSDVYYLNKIPEQIEVPLSSHIKAYSCSEFAAPDNPVSLDQVVTNESGGQYFVDIVNNKIESVYEQCLP